ncbi:hypothetical protein [Polaribacter sp.]|uniref:hypothetical protein n=1 Tax=Polaribacter sp. TaxID=1920175 RepID=UPI003EFB3910
MKKITQIIVFLLLALITSFSSNSQEILKPTNEKTYSEYMNKVLDPLIKNDTREFKNGILYDRVFLW